MQRQFTKQPGARGPRILELNHSGALERRLEQCRVEGLHPDGGREVSVSCLHLSGVLRHSSQTHLRAPPDVRRQ